MSLTNYNHLTEEEKKEFLKDVVTTASDPYGFEMITKAINYSKEKPSFPKPDFLPINNIP